MFDLGRTRHNITKHNVRYMTPITSINSVRDFDSVALFPCREEMQDVCSFIVNKVQSSILNILFSFYIQ